MEPTTDHELLLLMSRDVHEIKVNMDKKLPDLETRVRNLEEFRGRIAFVFAPAWSVLMVVITLTIQHFLKP